MMNIIKKITALGLAAVMCLSLSVPALATDQKQNSQQNTRGITFTATASEESVKQGGTVEVAIKISQEVTINNGQFEMDLPDGWTVEVEPELIDFAKLKSNQYNPDTGLFVYAGKPAVSGTNLVKFTVKVPADAAEGTYSIGVKDMTMGNTLSGNKADRQWEDGACVYATIIVANENNPNSSYLSVVAINRAPFTMAYQVEHDGKATFDPTGLILTASYEDGSTKDIPYSAASMKFEPADMKLAIGTTSIKVTYTENGVSKDALITGITVTEKKSDQNESDQENTSITFGDVSNNAYYYDAVAWAVGKGVTTGTSATTFAPNQACTRAQIVTFLWRAAGSPEPTSMSAFRDVSASDYYAKAIAWAVEKGITTGTSATTFSPNSVCTRAQAVTFLCRAVGTQGQANNNFSDVSSNAYYAGSVAWAVANGVTDGVGNGLFAPNNNCTRAQIVTFLYRAYQGK